MKAILAFLLLGAYAYGQTPPVLKINGPSKANVGDIIILDASESTAKHFHWLVDTSGVTLPDGKDQGAAGMAAKLRALGFKVEAPKNGKSFSYLMLEGGKKVILASYPGTWRVILAGSNESGVDQMAWTLVVMGNGPQPPPGPGPDPKPPEPEPPVPTPPTSSIGKGMYDAGMAATSPTRLADAKAMIQGLKAYRPKLVATQETNLLKIVGDILLALRNSVGEQEWKGWNRQIVSHVAKPIKDNIKDKATAVLALDQMIAGLEAVR